MNLWKTMWITFLKLSCFKLPQVFHRPLPTLFTHIKLDLTGLKGVFLFIHNTYKEDYSFNYY